MKLKILMCECNIYILFQKRVNHFQSSKFVGCDCNDKHKYFEIYCSSCSYNANFFTRNYFQPTNYYCFAEDKDIFCGFCLTLKLTLNENIYKPCIDEEGKDDLWLKLIPINENLYKKIKASLSFIFDKQTKKLCLDRSSGLW